MILQNPRHKNRGVIKTGIYVGTAHFKAVRKSPQTVVEVDLEIQSTKASYRKDYRRMLSDIASYYTDLVMQQGAPGTQKSAERYIRRQGCENTFLQSKRRYRGNAGILPLQAFHLQAEGEAIMGR